MAITTIQGRSDEREQLFRLMAHPRETYDDRLVRLLALIPEGDKEGSYTDAFRLGLLEARADIRAGRFTGHAHVQMRLGLRGPGRSSGRPPPAGTSAAVVRYPAL